MKLESIKKMADLDLHGKVVLIREDLNVPLDDQGHIADDTRIQKALPTIELAKQKGAKQIIIISHLGRPKEGEAEAAFSLKPVAHQLTKLLGQKVPLLTLHDLQTPGHSGVQTVLLENVRFNKGEKADDDALAKQYASLCDVFVMDAFATSHRAHASTHGVAKYAPVACAGPLLVAELTALSAALQNPKRPLLAIVGGSKVSTKITVLDKLIDKVDQLIVGGGIANTFLAATGVNVGKSLYEADWLEKAGDFLRRAEAKGVEIPLPVDVVVGKAFDKNTPAEHKTLDQLGDDDMVFDIGVETMQLYRPMVDEAQTIVWNGPVGVFEFDQFAAGTQMLAEAIADSDAYSIAGGGDTLAALAKFHLSDKMSYISTAGGAFLEFMEGKELPGVQILEN